jgi:radical SAM protein with 4Fe4S-binding SPASM domain
VTALDERTASRATDAFPLVQRVAFYVTLSCNLQCKHCYIEGSPANGRLRQPDRQRIIEAVGRLGKPVDLTGGEPLLDPDLPALGQALHAAGASIGSVFTNATLVRRRRAQVDALGNLAPGLRFFVSLDGDQAAHDTLRGSGAFTAALEGASLLKAMGFPVFVNTMLHASVNEDSLTRLYRTINDRAFDRWRLDAPFDAGAWTAHRNDHELGDDSRIRLLADVVGRWAADGMPFELEAGHVLKYLAGTVYFLDNYRLDDPICPCRTLPVWPNGAVSWCQDLSEPRYIVGNLLRDSLDEVYARYAPYKTLSIGDVGRSNGVCAGCPLITKCGVGCRVGALGNGGGFDDPDPGACSLYRNRAYQPVAEALRRSLATRPAAPAVVPDRSLAKRGPDAARLRHR